MGSYVDSQYVAGLGPGVKAAAVRVGWYGDVYGIDWGNLEAAWPTGAFSPDDPWVTKSLKVWDEQTFEGIFGYPEGGMENLLHSYTTSSIGITHVRRGDQSEALQYLYGMLIHTSGTHMAAEAMRAYERWGRHGSQTDTMPHGEFSGKYLTTLHDMLAFEGQDGTLHLANVWAPQWAKPGRRVQFAGDTDFGHLAYTIDVADGGAVMHLDPPTRDAPKSTVVSIPQNDAVTAVTVNGHSLHTFSGDRITLPKLTGPATIEIGWKQQDPAPAYSFARAVSDYLASYHKMTSPPKARVEDTATAHPTVRAGDLFQVTANVVNTGGAGYLDDPRVRLYVDGKPAQTDDRALAKGIGFTTPESVISFKRHSEGVVPVGLATTVCRPGEHTLGVALGDSQPTRTVTINVLPLVPTQPAPPADLALDASTAFVGSHTAATATATAAYGWETEKWKGRTKGSAEGETTMVVCTGTPPAADPKARAQWDFTLGCAADLSGHGRVGGVGSGVTFTDTGASFNGTDDGAITIPYGADYQPESIRAGQTWTLDLVGVVPEKVGGGYQAIANARSASGDYSAGWTVYVNPDGTFTFRMSPVNHPANTYAIASSGVHAVAGKPYDIRARWDGSHLSIAVSGAGSGSGSATTDGGYLPVVNGSMTLGKGTTGLADASFFTGSIAATKITVE